MVLLLGSCVAVCQPGKSEPYLWWILPLPFKRVQVHLWNFLTFPKYQKWKLWQHFNSNFKPIPPQRGVLKKWRFWKLVGEPKLQNMICSAIKVRPAYKISVLYLQNQARFINFSLVNVTGKRMVMMFLEAISWGYLYRHLKMNHTLELPWNNPGNALAKPWNNPWTPWLPWKNSWNTLKHYRITTGTPLDTLGTHWKSFPFYDDYRKF